MERRENTKKKDMDNIITKKKISSFCLYIAKYCIYIYLV